jgi:hypothetical protein
VRHNPPSKTEDTPVFEHLGAPGGWTPCQLSARARTVFEGTRRRRPSTGHRVFAVLQPRNGGRIMPNSLERHLDGVRAKSRQATRTRHNPAFGITPLMPHAALSAHMREIVSRGGRRVGTNPTAAGPCVCPDHGAIPWNAPGFSACAKRWNQIEGGAVVATRITADHQGILTRERLQSPVNDRVPACRRRKEVGVPCCRLLRGPNHR